MPNSDPEMTHPLPCILNHAQPTINIHNKPIIWVLGGPGIGKGVQCDLLRKRYGFTHLSIGEVLRGEVRKGGERSVFLHSTMKKGDLVPNHLQLGLLREEMQRREPTVKGFIIDGFPRARDQGIAFEKHIAPATLVVYLEATPETMMQRLKSRAAAAAVRRADDNEQVYQDRIDTFFEECHLVINQYMKKLCRVNAEGSIEQVFHEVQKCVDPYMKKANILFPA